MRTVVVLGSEICQKRKEGLIVIPKPRREPFFERAHKTFGNPIGLGPMSGNHNMEERFCPCQFIESLRSEVSAPVRDQELEFCGE